MASLSESYVSTPLRLPFAPKLLHDETISSWIDRLATCHRIERQHLLRSICRYHGLPAPAEHTDWDIEPIPEVLSALEQATNLPSGILARHRMGRSLFGLVPSARYAYCPICAGGDLNRGQLPAFRRRWALAITTHCSIHGVPLKDWPHLLSGAWGERMFAPQARIRACSAWTKESEPHWPKRDNDWRYHLSDDLRSSRGYRQGFANQSPAVTITWQQQVELEQNLLRAFHGKALSGPLQILGSGLALQHAVRDIYALLVTKMGNDPFWPRILAMTNGLFPNALWGDWRRAGGDFYGFDPDFCDALNLGTQCVETRRSGLYVLYQCLQQLVEMARADVSRVSGPARESHITLTLAQLPEVIKKVLRERIKKWPVRMQQFCKLPLEELPPASNFARKLFALDVGLFDPLRDQAPSILSLVPLQNANADREELEKRQRELWHTAPLPPTPAEIERENAKLRREAEQKAKRLKQEEDENAYRTGDAEERSARCPITFARNCNCVLCYYADPTVTMGYNEVMERR